MLGARYTAPPPPIQELPARPRPVPRGAESVAPSPIAPGPCARWARSEGIGLGDTAILLVADPLEAAALRQGFAWVGARSRDLDPAIGARDLAEALSGAAVAIVDTRLAANYARALEHLDRLPAVWWNGPGADFARLDLALAEHG
jgi:hypothetical protein